MNSDEMLSQSSASLIWDICKMLPSSSVSGAGGISGTSVTVIEVEGSVVTNSVVIASGVEVLIVSLVEPVVGCVEAAGVLVSSVVGGAENSVVKGVEVASSVVETDIVPKVVVVGSMLVKVSVVETMVVLMPSVVDSLLVEVEIDSNVEMAESVVLLMVETVLVGVEVGSCDRVVNSLVVTVSVVEANVLASVDDLVGLVVVKASVVEYDVEDSEISVVVSMDVVVAVVVS